MNNGKLQQWNIHTFEHKRKQWIKDTVKHAHGGIQNLRGHRVLYTLWKTQLDLVYTLSEFYAPPTGSDVRQTAEPDPHLPMGPSWKAMSGASSRRVPLVNILLAMASDSLSRSTRVRLLLQQYSLWANWKWDLMPRM